MARGPHRRRLTTRELLVTVLFAGLALCVFAVGHARAAVAPAGGLPDGRAYEQVTPVEKNGLNVQGKADFVQAAASGEAILYPMKAPLPGAEGAQEFPTVFQSARGPGSWGTGSLQPSAALGTQAAVLGWNEELSESFSMASPHVGGVKTLYARDAATGAMHEIGEVGSEIPAYVGQSRDGGVLSIETWSALTSAAEASFGPNVYVWDREDGEFSLAGVLNDGEPASEEGTFAGPYDWWEEAPWQGGAEHGYFSQATHVLSADGSKLWFTAAWTGALYLRENPTASQSAYTGEEDCTEPAAACTRLVSRPNTDAPADPNGERPAIFATATPDGSKAFFMSGGKLTADATTGPGDEGNDLYMYEAGAPEGQRLTDLTPDTEAGDAAGAEVRGVVGSSEDGSYVYFVANGVLAQGATRGNCSPLAGGSNLSGECNLYVWHDGVTRLIARLTAEGYLQQGVRQSDVMDWLPTSTQFGGYPVQKAARVTPGGTAIVFASQNRLTGYDNEGKLEFYRYTYGTPGVTCLSCDPGGAPPTGSASIENYSYEVGSYSAASILTRNLSASGDRFFFQSPDELVPADVNGEAGCGSELEFTGALACQDVYEWEASGTGSCTTGSSSYSLENGGCISLISTGTSNSASYFADASEEGEDVFFDTTQPLVAQDRDALVDIYDARIGGGIASQDAEEPSPCVGESCRGAAQTAPANESSGSSGYVGPTNPRPACHKAYVRRNGRCVKKKAHKKHHHRKRARHQGKRHHNKKNGGAQGKATRRSGGRR